MMRTAKLHSHRYVLISGSPALSGHGTFQLGHNEAGTFKELLDAMYSKKFLKSQCRFPPPFMESLFLSILKSCSLRRSRMLPIMVTRLASFALLLEKSEHVQKNWAGNKKLLRLLLSPWSWSSKALNDLNEILDGQQIDADVNFPNTSGGTMNGVRLSSISKEW